MVMIPADHARPLVLAGTSDLMSEQDEQQSDDEYVSKTQRKRDMHALQDLGEALVALPASRLAELDLPERLHDAVAEARRISKFGALRRQLQYIGRLMRDIDSSAIAARLDAWNGQSREATAHLHQLERWRERLLAEDAALTEFAAAVPFRAARYAATEVKVYCDRRVLALESSMIWMSNPAFMLCLPKVQEKLSTTWRMLDLKSKPALWVPSRGEPKLMAWAPVMLIAGPVTELSLAVRD